MKVMEMPQKTHSLHTPSGDDGGEMKNRPCQSLSEGGLAGGPPDARLQHLTLQVIRAERQERERIARLIHDHLQEILVAARLQMGALRRRSDSGDMLAAVHDVDELVRQALDVSETLTAELAPVALREEGLEAAIRELASQMAARHELRVTVETAGQVEPDSCEIKMLLFEAVRELLFNVVKHAGVDAARVALSRESEDCLNITVEDDGAGLAPSAERKGAFGIASIRERLEMIGGGLDVLGRPGGGTRVKLRSPVHMNEADREEDAEAEDSDGASEGAARKGAPASQSTIKPIRVLLADDHRILREGLAGILGVEPDIKVVGEASDGQMALELARKLRPDVVVMDVTMPRMNGQEATKRLKAEMPEVRVIALSMHSREDMAAAMKQAGACAYFTKGGPSELLVAAVRTCGRN